MIRNIDTGKTWLFDVVKDIEEDNDLSDIMPLKEIELKNILTNYLEKHDAENVIDFRKKRRKIIVETAIPTEEDRLQKIKRELKSLKGKNKYDLETKLKKTKKYLK